MATPSTDPDRADARPRSLYERFGLLFILIGIVLGIAVGVGYGQTMWLATGGPERRLTELHEILRQKSPAERHDSEASARREEAYRVAREIAELETTYQGALYPPAIQAQVDALDDQIAAHEREAAFHETMADALRRGATDAERARVARLDAEIARMEAFAKMSNGMREAGSDVLPVAIFDLLEFAGELFLRTLKLLVIPLILTSIVVGITSLGDIRKVGRMGATALTYYLLTTSMAVAIGLFLVLVVRPGVGGDDAFSYETTRVAGAKDATPFSTALDVFRGEPNDAGSGMFPANIFLAASQSNILGLLVFTLVFGAALTTLGPVGMPVIGFFRGANEAVMKMIHLVMMLAPVGIFGLVGANIARNGGGAEFLGELERLGWYVLTVAVGLAIHFSALMAILFVVGRRNPFVYVRNLSRALLTACTTASSNATLPVTMEGVKKNGISDRTANFVLPLGATANLDGTALYEAVAVVFIAQSLGIDLSIAELLIIFLTATLGAFGAAGIPEAGLVTLVMVLTAVGLPASGIGMILAVDWFLDRLRTTVNVFGDAAAVGVIDRIFGGAPPDSPPSPSASLASDPADGPPLDTSSHESL